MLSPKPLVALSQRVQVAPRPSGAVERRDTLDQAWARLLRAAGCLPLPMPNDPDIAEALMQDLPIEALVLTGGEDLTILGGDRLERDATEARLFALARRWKLPILGVCRGMQVVQAAFGVPLSRVEGHVQAKQEILIAGKRARVHSAHRWGAMTAGEEFEAWAHADDGVIKAIRHRIEPIVGIMWHPERAAPFAPRDVALLASLVRCAEPAIP